VTTEPKNYWELGSDLPLVNPEDDEFGYALFASLLADAIVSNRSPQGLVLAVHGKWGSGKSSLLNFIKHDLNRLPAESQPVMIDFNPWWFEGRDQIASQLLEQFSAQLPDRLKQVRELVKLVGKYSKQIADAAADVSGYGWIKKPLAWLLGWIPGLKFLSEKTGIPSIKKKVAAALKASGKRFVFFVDDIDRLTPDEARDFFRAIKALGDFPEVVYVLFFDREEVGRALTTSLNMDGEAYLEKIVQAPFHLPAVEKGKLQQKLFKGLDSIIESKPMPFPFDQGRWAEIYSEGLDQFIKKPRDIVRILNSISVTYPPLAGEVNPVDFIALEFLRVFEPLAYGSIRDAKEFFCGAPSQFDHKKAEEKSYFVKWQDSLPEKSRAHVALLVGRLFPKVAQVLGSGMASASDYGEWRQELRPCSTDCFGVYFQFGLPAGHVSRAELDQLTSDQSSNGMASFLLDAKQIVLPDGHSKARDLIDRLRDLDQLPPVQASKLIKALVDNAHLLLSKEDEKGGFFSMPNRWRIGGLISKQLERLSATERQELLSQLVKSSPGLWSLVDLAEYALQAKRDSSKAPRGFLDLEEGFAEKLAQSVGHRLDKASLEELMAMPDLDFIVHRWAQWGNPARIREVFNPMIVDDDKLIALIDKFVRTGLRQSGRETTETYQLSMKPLSEAIDIQAIEARVRAINSQGNLTVRHQVATKRFLQGLQAMAEGKDLDTLRFHDDD
jgi:predicted KAP-like P-loop ATPase